MSTQSYINKKIEALSRSAGTPFACWTSPDGLPLSLLQPGLEFPLLPTVYARLELSPHGDPKRLMSFLHSELGFAEGVDYQLHGNGMRGGVRFADFGNVEAIHRLENYAAQKGLEAESGESASELSERANAEMQRRSEQTNKILAEKFGYGLPPRA